MQDKLLQRLLSRGRFHSCPAALRLQSHGADGAVGAAAPSLPPSLYPSRDVRSEPAEGAPLAAPWGLLFITWLFPPCTRVLLSVPSCKEKQLFSIYMKSFVTHLPPHLQTNQAARADLPQQRLLFLFPSAPETAAGVRM